MADQDPVLALLDDLVVLLRGSVAASIEVSADSFSLAVTRETPGPTSPSAAPPTESPVAAVRTQHVHATTVGIFSATRAWAVGEAVARGDILGGVQSLGHLSELASPADGVIADVLVSGGAPVEYGQALFSITIA